jgi:hypothetical protein
LVATLLTTLKDMKKDEVIRLRVHDAHKDTWREAAARDGRSMSDWLRWLADRRLWEQYNNPELHEPAR